MNLDSIRAGISASVRDAAERLWGVHLESVAVERPPSLSMGDFASPAAFDLAKALRKAPRVIASEVAGALALPDGVREARVEGAGYLNFFLDRGRLAAAMQEEAPPPLAREGKTIVEHTNINPNKAAHIGHLRNATLGDVLARSLAYLGHRVEVQNYLDDTGVQVADVVAGLTKLKGVRSAADVAAAMRGEPLPDGSRDPRGIAYLCWDVYAEVARVYEERPETREWRAEVLHAIEEGTNETAKIAEVLTEAIVSAHLATMGRLGVAYDLLPRESDILRKDFWKRAFDRLKGSGAVLLETEGKHAGCWVLRLADSPEFAGMEEPDKILVRSNGTVTYTAKDIAYQLWKFGLLDVDFEYERFRPEWNSGAVSEAEIPKEVRERPLWRTARDGAGVLGAPDFGHATAVINVIDVRQSYLQKVVKEGLRVLGYESEAERSVHFSYETVALTPRAARELAQRFQEEYRLSPEDEKKPFVEMSGRKGLGVKIDDLVDLLLERSRKEIALRRKEQDAEAEQDARAIAVGALRYFLLKFGKNKVIAFDFDDALNFEGDTGPYLQYSLVRADNIFRKLAERGLSDGAASDADVSADWDDDLWTVVLDAAAIPEVVERAVSSLELSNVARHAFALAQGFNHFYHRQPIVNEADPAVRARRIAVARIFRAAMSRLLDLLGIPEPGRM